MSSNDIFKANALLLQQQLKLRDSHIADLASARAGKLTKAYVGRILKSPNSINITLDKVDSFAAAFNCRPADMLNPQGFENNGKCNGKGNGDDKGTGQVLDTDVLEQSILLVDSIFQHIEAVDGTLRAKAIALVYGHKMKSDTSALRGALLQLLVNHVCA